MATNHTTMDNTLGPKTLEFSLGGEIGRRLEAVTRQWILPAPYANPGMAGTAYETWLPVQDAPPQMTFTCDNPLRSQRGQ